MKRDRLYFFPAFLPLIELFPWLLSAVGVVAGAIPILRKTRHKIIVLCAVFVIIFSIFALKAYRTNRVLHKLSTESVWYQPLARAALSDLVLADGKLVFGTYQGTVEIHDAKDGSYLKSFKKNEPVLAKPLVVGDRLYAGEGLHTSKNVEFTAYNLSTGEKIWSYKSKSHLESEARLYGEEVVFTDGEEGIKSVNANTGLVSGSIRLGHTDVSPTLLKDSLWAVAKKENTALFRVNLKNGQTEKITGLSDDPWGAPYFIAKDKVYVSTSYGQVGGIQATDRGTIALIDTAKKEIIQKIAVDAFVVQYPSKIKDGVVYAAANGEVLALDADGGKLWQIKLDERFYSAPVAFKYKGVELVVLASNTGNLVILSAKDGRVVRKIEIPTGAMSAPVFSGGILYLATPKTLSALRIYD